MVRTGNGIAKLPFLDMVPFRCHFITIIRLPILKQLIYLLLPFLQPDLSEISCISTKPGKMQHFKMIKDIVVNMVATSIPLPYGKHQHVIPNLDQLQQQMVL